MLLLTPNNIKEGDYIRQYPKFYKYHSEKNVFTIYNPDRVHPHSDVSGDANKVYAGVISEFIKTCR